MNETLVFRACLAAASHILSQIHSTTISTSSDERFLKGRALEVATIKLTVRGTGAKPRTTYSWVHTVLDDWSGDSYPKTTLEAFNSDQMKILAACANYHRSWRVPGELK